MFHQNNRLWGNYRLLQLADPTHAYAMSLLPQKGATLLEVRMQGKTVLDGYTSPQEAATHAFSKNDLLAPFPNRLAAGTYTFEGQTYQFPINDTATQSALHGFVLGAAFEVEEVDCGNTFCTVTLHYHYEGTQAYYPFPFSLTVRYQLDTEAGFTMQVQCHNIGSTRMPFGLGWHPYFRLGTTIHTLRLQLPPVEQVLLDERMHPTGARQPYTGFEHFRPLGDATFDTCFYITQTEADGKASVLLENTTHQVRFWQNVPQGFRYLQLYTPPDRRAIAIEPMSCGVNAFQTGKGLLILEPQQKHKWTCGFELYQK